MEVYQICRDRIDEDDDDSNIVILPGRDRAHKSCYEENQMYEDRHFGKWGVINGRTDLGFTRAATAGR